MERPVNVLMSKNLRIVVVCQTCPVSPDKFAGNQKSACVHLQKGGNRSQRRDKNAKTVLKKIQQCDYYGKDSLVRKNNGLAVIDCTFN